MAPRNGGFRSAEATARFRVPAEGSQDPTLRPRNKSLPAKIETSGLQIATLLFRNPSSRSKNETVGSTIEALLRKIPRLAVSTPRMPGKIAQLILLSVPMLRRTAPLHHQSGLLAVAGALLQCRLRSLACVWERLDVYIRRSSLADSAELYVSGMVMKDYPFIRQIRSPVSDEQLQPLRELSIEGYSKDIEVITHFSKLSFLTLRSITFSDFCRKSADCAISNCG